VNPRVIRRRTVTWMEPYNQEASINLLAPDLQPNAIPWHGLACAHVRVDLASSNRWGALTFGPLHSPMIFRTELCGITARDRRRSPIRRVPCRTESVPQAIQAAVCLQEGPLPMRYHGVQLSVHQGAISMMTLVLERCLRSFRWSIQQWFKEGTYKVISTRRSYNSLSIISEYTIGLSDSESFHRLTINEHYAKAFAYRKEREELERCP
jgi:hypothetical protein